MGTVHVVRLVTYFANPAHWLTQAEPPPSGSWPTSRTTTTRTTTLHMQASASHEASYTHVHAATCCQAAGAVESPLRCPVVLPLPLKRVLTGMSGQGICRSVECVRDACFSNARARNEEIVFCHMLSLHWRIQAQASLMSHTRWLSGEQ